jgi:WD40 repeat protein/serine/threonine protein kinase
MNESQIFANALKLATPDKQAEYLDLVCAGDDQLRNQLAALLIAHGTAPEFLEHLAGSLGGLTEDPPFGDGASAPPRTPTATHSSPVIGPYKLIEEIGEGGMGTVYMAQQTEPVKRLVALKVIKLGMDSRSVIARFEAERQALALMDHPNIARVFDAGTTETGRPYFVMELVKGVPLTGYCDDSRLSPRERLKLFIPVCQAIQHAHQKGIIHRDIKASNVLVALYDGEPVPKVIDFGVAKATGQSLTEKTLVTGFGAVVGTLEYMSPEQAELNQLDIDTRSDIYSLGVLLYELLTGSTPLDRKRFNEAAMLEMLRVIREVEPPKPSTRLSTLADSSKVAANRGLEPNKLSGLVRGELDWIVMKALEKDRRRRYETASGLADDVRRHLNDEPVMAGPPSSWYRLRKLARRNRAGMATAAIVASALVVGTAVAAWQAIRATRAESNALKALNEKEEARADEARQRVIALDNVLTALAREAETKAVLDFVENNVFAAARPEGVDGGLGHSVSLRKAVEAALPFVSTSFTEQPLIEARLRMTLGTSFDSLGEFRIAADQFQAARAIYTKYRGADHPDTLKAMHELASTYGGLRRYAEALSLQKAILALRSTKLGPDHPDTLNTMHDMAYSLYRLQQYAEALKLDEETLALRKARLGPTHPDTLRSATTLANGYQAVGRQRDALKVREETLALLKNTRGPDHQDTLTGMYNLARSYETAGRHEDSLKLQEETLAGLKAKFGADYPLSLLSMGRLAVSYDYFRRFDDANKLREEALALSRVKLGLDHPDTLDSMTALAGGYDRAGRHADGIKLREQALEIQKAKAGPNDPATLSKVNGLAWAHVSYGDSLRGQAQFAEARREYMVALKISPDDSEVLARLYYLALTLEQQGKPVDAEAGLREVLGLQPKNWEARHQLELLLRKQGQHAKADAELEQTIGLNPRFSEEIRSGLLPVRRFLGHTQVVSEVAFSPDGRTALSCGGDGMRLWDLGTGKQLRTFVGHSTTVTSVVFSHDGRHALSAGDDGTVRFWDCDTGQELRRFRGHSGIVYSAVLSSDERRVFSCGRDNTLRWWEVENGRQSRLLEVKNSPIRCVAISHDDRLLLWGGDDGIGRVSNLETGVELHRLEGHTAQIWHVAISLDGQMGLTAGQDKTILLWNLRTGKQVRHFQGHESDVNNLVFTPDGKRLLSVSDDETVRLWEVATGNELRRWKGHSGIVGAAAISPDGRFALSGGDDTCICLWRLPE